MKLIATLHNFTPDGPTIARRKAFRSRASAMRQCEKWARHSLRRFADASKRVQVDNWGFMAGAFPYQYVRAVVTWAPHY